MLKNKFSTILMLMLAATAGCSSNDDDDEPLSSVVDCSQLDGTTYYSQALRNAEQPTHSSLTFSDGALTLQQPSGTTTGSYECSPTQVAATLGEQSQQQLKFNEDLTFVEFNPPAGDTVIFMATPEAGDSQKDACNQVAGNNYQADELTTNLAEGEPVAAPTPFFHFGMNDQVDYSLDGSRIARGVYDCEWGYLHIHRNVDDAEPVPVDLNDDGTAITVNIDGADAIFSAQEDQVCATIFAPVCAIDLHTVQCDSPPCNLGTYHTYPNRCRADADGALFLYEGECGDEEGEPYAAYQDCADAYTPVCAAAQSDAPCGRVPCPGVVHQTFANDCQANANNASIVFEGECGAREDQAVTQLEGGCAAIYAPVCAKDAADNCVNDLTCAEFVYRTFSNSCRAKLELATIVWDDECASLEGTSADEEPPVHLVDSLPETAKDVTIMNPVIAGNKLTVTLGYSGCDPQHFKLFVERALGTAPPAQLPVMFKPMVEDECQAYFTTEFTYDLLPLKAAYAEASGSATGEVQLLELGTYTF